MTAQPDSESSHPKATHRDGSLVVDDVTVSFDGFRALDHLSLVIDGGELRCIIGPNGAGKTTMMDVITGKTRPDTGSVRLSALGEELTRLPEHQIVRLGIGRKFQRPTVFGAHTVFENLELALVKRRSVWSTLWRPLGPKDRARIDEVLDLMQLEEHRDRLAGVLSHGQKQWLEIGMLLVQDPQVIMLDEPVAGMSHDEVDRTAELILSLEGKHTIMVVEHDMDFVRRIARTVTVLHEGRVLAQGPMQTVQNDPKVIEVYLGA